MPGSRASRACQKGLKQGQASAAATSSTGGAPGFWRIVLFSSRPPGFISIASKFDVHHPGNMPIAGNAAFFEPRGYICPSPRMDTGKLCGLDRGAAGMQRSLVRGERHLAGKSRWAAGALGGVGWLVVGGKTWGMWLSERQTLNIGLSWVGQVRQTRCYVLVGLQPANTMLFFFFCLLVLFFYLARPRASFPASPPLRATVKIALPRLQLSDMSTGEEVQSNCPIFPFFTLRERHPSPNS